MGAVTGPRRMPKRRTDGMVDMGGFLAHESSYVDPGAEVGEGTRIWHFCHVQDGARIGRNCSLGQNINVAGGAVVGDGCRVQNNVSLYSGVELADNVFCGPSCVFTNDPTPRAKYPKGETGWLRTPVGKGATIGANATVVCGHGLGAWCMVAAGAVVTRDVLPHELVAGVPARHAGWVCECGAVLREPAGGGVALCASCGRRYAIEADGATELVPRA